MDPCYFIRWLRYAISRVGPGYFGHAERVYCYELYHYIRVAMHSHEQAHGPIDEIFLHSELVKTVLSNNDAQRYEVWSLRGLRVPDFLFHTPGNFNNQIAAIEVKTAALSRESLMDDLMKLTELRQNYRYKLGIFHCVNTDTRRLIELLTGMKEFHVNLDQDILVEVKPGYTKQLESFRLGDLLNG